MGPGHQGLIHARPPDTKLGDRCIESLIKGVQLIKFVINVMSLPILVFVLSPLTINNTNKIKRINNGLIDLCKLGFGLIRINNMS